MLLLIVLKNLEIKPKPKNKKTITKRDQLLLKHTHTFFQGRLVICLLMSGANLLKSLERGFEVSAR